MGLGGLTNAMVGKEGKEPVAWNLGILYQPSQPPPLPQKKKNFLNSFQCSAPFYTHPFSTMPPSPPPKPPFQSKAFIKLRHLSVFHFVQ